MNQTQKYSHREPYTNIILSVILKKKEDVSVEQSGFLKGKDTRNAIFAPRVLAERMIEKQKICFVDLVKHGELMAMLKSIQLKGKDLKLMKSLYWK